MNRSFSLAAVPPVVAVDVFNTAKLTAKIQELLKTSHSQQFCWYSDYLPSFPSISLPQLECHDATLPHRQTFWGTCSSTHNWDTNNQRCTARAKASKGLILLCFSAAQQALKKATLLFRFPFLWNCPGHSQHAKKEIPATKQLLHQRWSGIRTPFLCEAIQA